MEKYLKPEAEVIQFRLSDVISASGVCESDDPGCVSYSPSCYYECNETPRIYGVDC